MHQRQSILILASLCCFGPGCSTRDSGTGSPSGTSVGAGGAAGSPTGGASTGGAVGTGGNGTSGPGGASGASGTGGMGGSNAGGAAGAGGMVQIDLAESVLQRGKDSARTATFVQPMLSVANVARMAMDTSFQANFTGSMTASPLFVGSTVPGKGLFFAVTTQNDVYALDETTGAVVWRHNIGMPAGAGSPGPGITSRGILSTPVIDVATRAIFVAGGIGPGMPTRHEIHGLSIDTGDELPGGWPIDVSRITSGNVTFSPTVQIQRSALSLVNGILYVGFGGNYGDGGNYRGWVIAVNASDPTQRGAWVSMGTGEGIWAAGGMASDGNGVFAVTGNSKSAGNSHALSDGEEVIRITDMGTPHRDAANMFYPTNWMMMDSSDRDFGSSSPQVVAVPGSTPSTLLVAPAKPGHVYFLDASNLGGLGGQLRDLVVADQIAESVYTAPTAYRTAQGVHVAISTTVGSVCPGGVTNNQIISILLQAGAPPTPTIAWCATTAADDEVRRRSPISTTTDGQSDAIVWFMNGTKLNAFDGDTGALLFNGGADNCSGVHRFTSPIAAAGRVVVGGDGHLCSWSVH